MRYSISELDAKFQDQTQLALFICSQTFQINGDDHNWFNVSWLSFFKQ